MPVAPRHQNHTMKGMVTEADWKEIEKIPEYKGLHGFFKKLKEKPKTFLDLIRLKFFSKK